MEMIPNFTQIPNVLLDDLLSELSKGELKVVLYISRRTYGFHKVKDKISLSQLENGIEGYDKGTGLNRDTIIQAVSSLEQLGVILVDRNGMINEYQINLDYGSRKNELVGLAGSTSRKNPTKLVGKTDTQKKRNKEQKKEDIFDSFDEETKKWLNREAWNDWEEFRKEKKTKLTNISRKKQIKLLSEHKRSHVDIINKSITMGWLGLFPDKKFQEEKKEVIRKPSKEEIDEQLLRQMQEIKNNSPLKTTKE